MKSKFWSLGSSTDNQRELREGFTPKPANIKKPPPPRAPPPKKYFSPPPPPKERYVILWIL